MNRFCVPQVRRPTQKHHDDARTLLGPGMELAANSKFLHPFQQIPAYAQSNRAVCLGKVGRRKIPLRPCKPLLRTKLLRQPSLLTSRSNGCRPFRTSYLHRRLHGDPTSIPEPLDHPIHARIPVIDLTVESRRGSKVVDFEIGLYLFIRWISLFGSCTIVISVSNKRLVRWSDGILRCCRL